MSNGRPVATVLAIVALVTAAGCGGSGGTLTRAELISQADAICKQSNAKRESTGREKSPNYAQLAAVEQNAVNGLRKLTPPASMEAAWKHMLAVDQTLVDDTDKFAEYYSGYNQRGSRAMLEAAAPVQRSLEIAGARSGFVDCAQFS